MTVEVRVIEYGRRSEGKTSRNEPTSRSVHSVSTMSFLEFGLDVT